MFFQFLTSRRVYTFGLLFASALALCPSSARACSDPPLVWTIQLSYTDASSNQLEQSRITGDGVQADASGSSVYSNNGGSVLARLNDCGTNPSYDATLQVSKGRTFNVDLTGSLGNAYGKYPPTSVFSNESGLLNISNIQWCQNNGYAATGCTFYTRMTSAFTGPDRNTYHLRMESKNSGVVPTTSWALDGTANSPYPTSPVQVVYKPASLAGGKDTYVVTPVLQSTSNTSSLSAIGVLIQGTTGNSYNFGQYAVPFKFVIQTQ